MSAGNPAGILYAHNCVTTALQVDVLVEGFDDDDNLVGRTQWDAPDVDPVVFLTPASDPSIPMLESGQMRRCLITETSLFDLQAQPII